MCTKKHIIPFDQNLCWVALDLKMLGNYGVVINDIRIESGARNFRIVLCSHKYLEGLPARMHILRRLVVPAAGRAPGPQKLYNHNLVVSCTIVQVIMRYWCL